MAFVSTVTIDPIAQADGSVWVTENHDTSIGPVRFSYLAPGNIDANAVMQGRRAAVAEYLAEQEYERAVSRDAAFSLSENTAAQFAARLREDFKNSRESRACYLAWWLLRRIAAGHVTDTQCRNAFGLTITQWNNLKTGTLTPRSDAYAATIGAGEV